MKIYLANPRGFCAGVDRAIDIVELSLKAYGAPIYVRHEIVHSRHVVNSLKLKGAVFVEELSEVPDGQTVIFSAHGVAKSVWEVAKRRGLKIIDATCPLVIKVHNEVNRDYTQGYELILIGHAGHPEVIGTLGQVPDKFHLVSSVEDVHNLHVEKPDQLSYVTQTTLSVDECRDIVAALHKRFPKIKGPHQEDICYATQNRQNAVKKLTEEVDVILVIGSPNSSNSNRLRELGEHCGVPSYLIDSSDDINLALLQGIKAVGISAGASAPEVLGTEVLEYLKAHGGGVVDQVPYNGGAGRRPALGGEGDLVPARVQHQAGASARDRQGVGRPLRGGAAEGPRAAAGLQGHRPLYGRRNPCLRIPRRCAHPGHQRDAGPASGVCGQRGSQEAEVRLVEPLGGLDPEGEGVRFQSGAHGLRRHCLHGARPLLPALPNEGLLQDLSVPA